MPNDCGWRCGEFTWEHRLPGNDAQGRMKHLPVKDGESLASRDIHCSHCGSVTPDAFMSYVREGGLLGATDKQYKIYVWDHDKFYMNHLTDTDHNIEFATLLLRRKLKIDEGRFYAKIWIPNLPEGWSAGLDALDD